LELSDFLDKHFDLPDESFQSVRRKTRPNGQCTL
jgi:hypothetical protein